MLEIRPMSDLQSSAEEVFNVARVEPVHLTEDGYGAFVLMSEEVLGRLIAQERADAAAEASAMTPGEIIDSILGAGKTMYV